MYDIAYYKRKTGQGFKAETSEISQTEETEELKRALKYQVMPLHIPKPFWWDHQLDIIADAKAKNIPPFFGDRFKVTSKPETSEQTHPGLKE